MDTSFSWRELLGKIISDPRERKRIAEALNLHAATLVRWSTNKSNPRQDNLLPLLDAVPSEYRGKLFEAIREEFPHFFTVREEVDSGVLEIPSAFYDRVLKAYTSSPHQLRSTTVITLILQQALTQLDPMQHGGAVTLAQCVPPLPGRPVRSLRHILGRGTSPWPSHMAHATAFLGSETIAGYAVVQGRLIAVGSRQEMLERFPLFDAEYLESAAICPIQLSDRIAGCLCAISTQQNYFSEARQDLLRCYAALLTVAFGHDEFYEYSRMDLGMMPPYRQQRPLLAKFGKRVTQVMLEATARGEFTTRPQAEVIVWQQLEEEFLRLPLTLEE